MRALLDVAHLKFVRDELPEMSGDQPFSAPFVMEAETPFGTRYVVENHHPADAQLIEIDGDYVNFESLVEKYGEPGSDSLWSLPHWQLIYDVGDSSAEVIAKDVDRLTAVLAARKDFRVRVLKCLTLGEAS